MVRLRRAVLTGNEAIDAAHKVILSGVFILVAHRSGHPVAYLLAYCSQGYDTGGHVMLRSVVQSATWLGVSSANKDERRCYRDSTEGENGKDLREGMRRKASILENENQKTKAKERTKKPVEDTRMNGILYLLVTLYSARIGQDLQELRDSFSTGWKDQWSLSLFFRRGRGSSRCILFSSRCSFRESPCHVHLVILMKSSRGLTTH